MHFGATNTISIATSILYLYIRGHSCIGVAWCRAANTCRRSGTVSSHTRSIWVSRRGTRWIPKDTGTRNRAENVATVGWRRRYLHSGTGARGPYGTDSSTDSKVRRTVRYNWKQKIIHQNVCLIHYFFFFIIFINSSRYTYIYIHYG